VVVALGADRVIDYTAEGFHRDEQWCDVMLDAVGKSTYRACRLMLNAHGGYMSTELGPDAQNLLLALVTGFGRGGRVVFAAVTYANAPCGQGSTP
jgi:NADPH:quinone reductase-like Zn-dependent oxidoreductase